MRGSNYFYFIEKKKAKEKKTEAQGNHVTWPKSFKQEVKSELKNVTQINKHMLKEPSQKTLLFTRHCGKYREV